MKKPTRKRTAKKRAKPSSPKQIRKPVREARPRAPKALTVTIQDMLDIAARKVGLVPRRVSGAASPSAPERSYAVSEARLNEEISRLRRRENGEIYDRYRQAIDSAPHYRRATWWL